LRSSTSFAIGWRQSESVPPQTIRRAAATGVGSARELKKKRAELVRVLERLNGPDLSPGMACELRKRVAILEAEISELQARS